MHPLPPALAFPSDHVLPPHQQAPRHRAYSAQVSSSAAAAEPGIVMMLLLGRPQCPVAIGLGGLCGAPLGGRAAAWTLHARGNGHNRNHACMHADRALPCRFCAGGPRTRRATSGRRSGASTTRRCVWGGRGRGGPGMHNCLWRWRPTALCALFLAERRRRVLGPLQSTTPRERATQACTWCVGSGRGARPVLWCRCTKWVAPHCAAPRRLPG